MKENYYYLKSNSLTWYNKVAN